VIQKARTFIAVIAAIHLCGFGVALFVESNLGSDTLTVLEEGMSLALGITIGQASLIYNCINLVIALIIAKEHIGWATLWYGLWVGRAIDYYHFLLMEISFLQKSLMIRVCGILLGQFCIVLALALLIRYRSGMSLSEAVIYGIEKKTGIPYHKTRTCFDIFYTILGWLMGGVVGIGTLLSMLTTGIGVKKCINLFDQKNG